MNHPRPFYCNFFCQIWNNYFLLEAMALHCTKLEGSRYRFMSKYEKLFSGSCTQFSSQLLNGPRWGARVPLSRPQNGSVQQLLPRPNGCWRLSCIHLPGWGGDKASRKRTDGQPRRVHRSTDRPSSTWRWRGGNPDCGFLGWLGAAGQFPSLVSMARAMVARLALPPAGFNASVVLQTGVSKLPAVRSALFPKILLQHGCCLQSRARGFSVAVHISHFSPQTSFEEKKTVIKQAGRWTFKPMANAWRGRTWQENGCIRDFLV